MSVACVGANGNASLAKRVNVIKPAVKAAIATLNGPFNSFDVVAAAGGGSPMTVRKAITELINDGQLQRLGPDPDWNQKGRAPILYRRTT